MLGQAASLLKAAAEKQQLPVLVTNQVWAWEQQSRGGEPQSHRAGEWKPKSNEAQSGSGDEQEGWAVGRQGGKEHSSIIFSKCTLTACMGEESQGQQGNRETVLQSHHMRCACVDGRAWQQGIREVIFQRYYSTHGPARPCAHSSLCPMPSRPCAPCR